MAGKRAEAAIAANPEKSDRAFAAEIGVNQSTRARKRSDAGASVGKRVGQDGKACRMPQRTAVAAAKVETFSVDDFDADDGSRSRWLKANAANRSSVFPSMRGGR